MAAGAAVYANSLAAPFIFDDLRWIRPARIGQLLPLSDLFSNGSRPLLNLTLAINYAIGGLDPVGYHIFNLVVHVLAGLTLAATVMRTLSAAMFAGRFIGAERALGFAAALIFLVHPLQTQAVTYTVQRCESLMTLLYLLTLYCVIRYAGSGARPAWALGAIVACALGMAAKEVMVTAPLLVLLYDRTFLAGSFAAALRARATLYAGLLATTGLLLPFFDGAALSGPESWAGFDLAGLTVLDYARSQPGVLLHYLRLVVWPDPLVLDYAWPVASDPAVYAPQVAIVTVLGAATLGALWRRPRVGFLPAAFFLILAPTSSVMPIRDLAFEHRMYPALASIVVAAVLSAHLLIARASAPRWVAGALLAVVAVALGLRTVVRNYDYHSPLAIWTSVVEAAPHNSLARMNLGAAYSELGRHAEAMEHLEVALRLGPASSRVHTNYGVALYSLGRRGEAIAHYRRALGLDGNNALAHTNLGLALQRRGDKGSARRHFDRAIEAEPDSALAQSNLANLLLQQGDLARALHHFRAALVGDPSMPNALAGAAYVLASSPDPAIRDPTEAIRLAERATQLTDHDDVALLTTLALAYQSAGRSDEAARVRAQAARAKKP